MFDGCTAAMCRVGSFSGAPPHDEGQGSVDPVRKNRKAPKAGVRSLFAGSAGPDFRQVARTRTGFPEEGRAT
jgi:hypothetical protein